MRSDGLVDLHKQVKRYQEDCVGEVTDADACDLLTMLVTQFYSYGCILYDIAFDERAAEEYDPIEVDHLNEINTLLEHFDVYIQSLLKASGYHPRQYHYSVVPISVIGYYYLTIGLN